MGYPHHGTGRILSLEPTYEGLKVLRLAASYTLRTRLEPTYEGLKGYVRVRSHKPAGSLEPTYEGLKAPGSPPGPGPARRVWSLPMRD